jgi:hypothetical protein
MRTPESRLSADRSAAGLWANAAQAIHHVPCGAVEQWVGRGERGRRDVAIVQDERCHCDEHCRSSTLNRTPSCWPTDLFTSPPPSSFLALDWPSSWVRGRTSRLMHVHAHVNLLGWVAVGHIGLLYMCRPQLQHGWMPHAHFWLNSVGLVVFMGGFAWSRLGDARRAPET